MFNDLQVESISESRAILNFSELNSPDEKDEVVEKLEIFARKLKDLLGEGARII